MLFQQQDNQERSQILIPGMGVVNCKYRVNNPIHRGKNSNIYSIIVQKSEFQKIRAIKTQSAKDKTSKIKNQVNTLKSILMENGRVDLKEGFPRLFEFGTENNIHYMVLEMCGPNLAKLLSLCGGKFKLRTLALIGLQITDRLEVLHQKKYLYLNMKPQNFVVGLNNQSCLITMIDFSKCILYKSKNKNSHIPYQSNIPNEVDPIFGSVNSHLNVQLSRRDDLESMIYMLVYLYKGKLPWDNDQKVGKKQSQLKIYQMKNDICGESLLKGMPIQYLDMFMAIKCLKFYEKPNYDLLRIKLWRSLMETDYQNLKKGIITYDWHELDRLDYEIHRQNPRVTIKRADSIKEIQVDNSDSDLM